MSLASGQYVATPPTLADGAVSSLLLDSGGKLVVAATVSGGGDATAANQATQIARAPASLGQKAMAASFAVVIASDQSAITVSSATFATAANQTTANTSLSSIDGKLAALGQHAAAGSASVVLASDQATIVTSTAKVSSASAPASLFGNLGANATLNVKASAGNLFGIVCRNRNVAAHYLQIHNTATTPSAAAVPLLSFLVPGSGEIGIGEDFFGPEGVRFSTGIAFAWSTTEDTYTAGTAADQKTFVRYA